MPTIHHQQLFWVRRSISTNTPDDLRWFTEPSTLSGRLSEQWHIACDKSPYIIAVRGFHVTHLPGILALDSTTWHFKMHLVNYISTCHHILEYISFQNSVCNIALWVYGCDFTVPVLRLWLWYALHWMQRKLYISLQPISVLPISVMPIYVISIYVIRISWWRHQLETFSALLTVCAKNSPVTGEFPSQRPVTLSFDVFLDRHPNKRLCKQSWSWWF